MNSEHPPDPLDHPEYLRNESSTTASQIAETQQWRGVWEIEGLAVFAGNHRMCWVTVGLVTE